MKQGRCMIGGQKVAGMYRNGQRIRLAADGFSLLPAASENLIVYGAGTIDGITTTITDLGLMKVEGRAVSQYTYMYWPLNVKGPGDFVFGVWKSEATSNDPNSRQILRVDSNYWFIQTWANNKGTEFTLTESQTIKGWFTQFYQHPAPGSGTIIPYLFKLPHDYSSSNWTRPNTGVAPKRIDFSDKTSLGIIH